MKKCLNQLNGNAHNWQTKSATLGRKSLQHTLSTSGTDKTDDGTDQHKRCRRSSLYLFRNSVYRRDGFSLEDFNILAPIGVGTFGDVYLCTLSGNPQLVHAPLTTKNGKTELYALKVMPIRHILDEGQGAHVKNERRILACVDHPFIVSLFWSGHSNSHLYLLMEFVPGGELFNYMKQAVRFDVSTARFYAAEIVSALDYLHAIFIAYRDLKPENCLLDCEGHLKLTDFGFAKSIRDRSYTLCGTPDYLAPEQLSPNRGHTCSVDWWALGILIYEMLYGFTPFADADFHKTCDNILHAEPYFSNSSIDSISRDLVKRLLTKDRACRLGCMRNKTEDIKKHQWFYGISWITVRDRGLKPPIKPPPLQHVSDVSNYEGSMLQDSLKGEKHMLNDALFNGNGNNLSQEEVDMFAEF